MLNYPTEDMAAKKEYYFIKTFQKMQQDNIELKQTM